MTRRRVQAMVRRGGERVALAAPERAILAALPVVLARQFVPSAAGGLEATFELRVGTEPALFAIRIAGGRCAVMPGPAPDAGAAVRIGADDLVRLASGVASWPELLSDRRMELSGDPFLGLRFPPLFGLPASVRI